jgi:hypothetical protein
MERNCTKRIQIRQHRNTTVKKRKDPDKSREKQISRQQAALFFFFENYAKYLKRAL